MSNIVQPGIFSIRKFYREDGQSLGEYLDNNVFADMAVEILEPDSADMAGFDAFMEQYKACLQVERTAVDFMQ